MQPWKVLKPWRRGWPNGEDGGEWWQDVCVHWWSWFMNSKVDKNPSVDVFFVHWESSSSKIPDPVFMSKIRRILSGIRCVNPPLPTDRWSPGWLKKKLETGPKCRRCSFPSQEPDFWANQTWSDRPPFILLCFIASAFRPYQQLSTRFASWLICKKISRLWHSFMWSPCSLHSITCF